MNPGLRRRSLLWWVCVMLFLLVVGPTIYQRWHRDREDLSRWRTVRAQIEAMEEALEAYKTEYGKYPRPVGGSKDPIVQAKMLYQAVTGDGTDFIDGMPPSASDGNPGTDGELFLEAAYAGSKRSGFVHDDHYLLDSWGRPYQYVRGDEHPGTSNPTTFDLWSEGSFEPNGERHTWIGNW